MKIWWGVNFTWLILFAIGTIYLLNRKIDGAGAVQSPQIRMVSLAVLGGFFIFVCLCQLIVLFFVKRRNK
ncbi:DUF3923 family protein [Companilactobacillus sp. HBUAS56275]|uniref:DUF3923 family protein n=1 Tax=Candidatus Companilactobacillus pullicola TaxID=2838523 RepID=A0A9D1ZMA4_9LACO|nr:DUF3923 family protein [Candidatus Companilactobacillus pullicola]